MSNSAPGPRSKGIQFSVGDRIMHKPALRMGVGEPLPDRVKEGTVLEAFYKTNRRGAKMPYVRVQWDKSAVAEVLMTQRVKPVSDQTD